MIEQLDKEFFLLLNSFHSSFFDQIMYWISSKVLWVPVYLFIIYSFFRKYRTKAIYITFILIALVGIGDLISVHLFKNVFLRYRPCHNADIQNFVHLVNNKCGGMYGFISSHATNSFVIVSFVSLIFRKKKVTTIAIFLGLLIGYSRIYLGVHYPADIIGGIVLGSSVGIIGYVIVSILILKNE